MSTYYVAKITDEHGTRYELRQTRWRKAFEKGQPCDTDLCTYTATIDEMKEQVTKYGFDVNWSDMLIIEHPITHAAKEFAELNAREQLYRVSTWLSWQNEYLSSGLRSPEDGLKLYRAWINREDLPEMADEETDDEGTDLAKVRVEILGYDPRWQHIEGIED